MPAVHGARSTGARNCNCSESMGEHLRGGPSFVMSNKPEQLLSSTAPTAGTMPWLTSAPCQLARPLSTMMPDHQPPGHGVLVRAAISRTPPEQNGIKWQQMALFTKIRIWDDATSYKRSMKNGVICAKACKNPNFPGQTMPFSGKAPALTNGPAKRLRNHQPASLVSASPSVTSQSWCDVFVR